MVLLVVVAGLYVSGGVAYNYKVTQQVAMPHRDFCAYTLFRVLLIILRLWLLQGLDSAVW